MKLLNRWLDKVDYFMGFISAGTLFLMMIWIFVDVIMRYFFNNPITGTIEITGEYLLPIIVYLAISYTHKQNGHINVDLLYYKFSKGTKRVVGLFTNVVGLLLFIILGISNFLEGLNYFAKDIQSVSLLDYPLAPAMMIISFGILLICIRLVFDSINILRNKKEF